MRRKLIAAVISVLALLALGIPACASAADIGQADPASYLSRMTTDGEYIYVMGTYQSKQVWVNKYSGSDAETPLASWTTEENDGYQYWAGDSSYNGALAPDGEGGVFLAAARGQGSLRELVVFHLNSDMELTGSVVYGRMTSPNPSGTLYNPAARDIAVSETGNIFIAGDTREKLDEWTDPAYAFDQFEKYSESGQRAGRRIGYLVRLDQELQLQGCTYLGSGSNGGTSAVNRILCDGQDVFVLGRDASGQVPAGEDVLQPEKTPQTSYSDSFDAFLARMDGASLQVKNATYYGGGGTEEVADMEIVGQNIYVLGDTTSDDILLSENAFDRERASSSTYYPAPFIFRVHKSLKKTDTFAATYFGDAGGGRIDSFALDAAGGKVYITGYATGPSAVPVTDGAATGRIFIAVLKGDLSALQSATVMGTGASGDAGRGICHVGGGLYLAGTRGTEGLIDTQIRQPFLDKIPESLAHARLTGLAMKKFVNAVQYLGAGQEILIKLTFDANVDVAGTPLLRLNIRGGGKDGREAAYVSGSGTKELVFSYTVQAGDTTEGDRLNTYGEDALILGEGAAISPAAGAAEDAADLTIPTGTANRLEYASGDRVYVNTIPAHVESVTAEKEDGTYLQGEEIPIVVTVRDSSGKPVKLSLNEGTLVLKLNSGGEAVFREFVETSGGNDGRLRFVYTAGETDQTEALDVSDAGALDLAGAVLTDPYGTEVDLTLPEPGTKGSISEGQSIAIERIPAIAGGTFRVSGSPAKKQMIVSWGPVSGATEYQYEYKAAASGQWIPGSAAGNTKAVLKGLKAKGLYQLRARACRSAADRVACGSWSQVQYFYLQKVSGVKARAVKGRKIKVSWKKQKGASGYQVLCSTKKNMKGAKVRTVKGAAKKTLTLKKLKKGKKYYIQIRPYKTYKGKKYIGVSSGVKAAKAKK